MSFPRRSRSVLLSCGEADLAAGGDPEMGEATSSQARNRSHSARRLPAIIALLAVALILVSPTPQARAQSEPTKAVIGRADTAPSSPGASAATWSDVPSPNTLIPQGHLQAVSCAAEGTCEAVGSYMDGSGILVPLAETWDGTSWALQTLPSPPLVDEAWLNGVSCPTTDDCEAVGGYEDSLGITVIFAEVWDGSSWSIQLTGTPVDGGNFYGVSCAGPDACEAVGTGPDGALAEGWDGTSWSVQATGGPESVATLYAVSCAAPDACEAVGTGPDGALAEGWDGTSWNIQTTTDPNATLHGVSCSGPDACEAVGFSGAAETTFAEAWDGTTWSAQDMEPVAGSLAAVSCIASDSCEAFGAASNGAGYDVIADVWNGTTWLSQTAAQTPDTGANTIDVAGGISCPVIGVCEAVGEYLNYGSPAYLPFVQGWDGTDWSLESSPDPMGTSSSELAAISCSDAADCEAVGNSIDEADNIVTLAERWNGTTWSIQTTPNPSSASWLDGISCISPSSCEAVGYYVDAEGNRSALAEAWDGTTWTLHTVPVPSDAIDSEVEAISCVSADDCEAVGLYTYDASGNLAGLVDIWNGIKWKLQSIPGPGTSIASSYEGVSCTSADDCEAVGSYFGSSTEEYPLVAKWNGTKWTRQSAPDPSGSTDAGLSGVWCLSADDCESVGDSYGASGIENSLAMLWNGTAWDLQAPLDGFNSKGSALTGVSCATSTTCEAVGAYGNSSGGPIPLIESWKKGKWTLQSASEPQTPFSGTLQSVSCVAKKQCMAAGADSSSGDVNVTWVEQYSG